MPKAPHIRLNAPVSASSTMTRRLPYPSAMNASLVFWYTKISHGILKFFVSLFPPLASLRPICDRNLPSGVNLRIMSSDRREPRSG